MTCLLCRYTTLGLKSVLRLPVHGIVIAMVYAWFTHYCVHIRMTWRTFLLNSYKLRILYALKEDKQGENSRHTHSLCETACRLRVHTQHTQRTPLVYTHTAPKTPTRLQMWSHPPTIRSEHACYKKESVCTHATASWMGMRRRLLTACELGTCCGTVCSMPVASLLGVYNFRDLYIWLAV